MKNQNRSLRYMQIDAHDGRHGVGESATATLSGSSKTQRGSVTSTPPPPYNGPLYHVLRQSDGEKLDIDVVRPGSYADAAARDSFCANTYCWIATVYDQPPKHSDLTQAPRGGFSGPTLGGSNNLPLADMAPVTIATETRLELANEFCWGFW
jgi:hypothetical protein